MQNTDLHPARFISDPDLINNIFTFIVLEDTNSFSFRVAGKPAPEYPPHIISLKVNGEEKCTTPKLVSILYKIFVIAIAIVIRLLV